MTYYAIVLIAKAHRFIGNREIAYQKLDEADWYCPFRNEHLVVKAEMLNEDERNQEMYDITSRLMGDDRLCPFPDWHFLLWTGCYKDTGDYVQFLHNIAMEKLGLIDKKTEENDVSNFASFPGEI